MLTLVIALGGSLACAVLIAAARAANASDRLRGNGERAPWRVSGRIRPQIARALLDADIAREPEEMIELWAIGVVAAVVASFALSPGIAPFVMVATLLGGPCALWFARERRDRRFAAELPAALEQVAAELRGGGTVSGAVERIAAGDGALAFDLQRVHTRTQLGLSLADSLTGWPAEHDAPGVRAAAGAFAVAATLGGGAADAIDGLATSLRHRLDAAAEANALSAQARLSAVVVGAAPIGYLAFSSAVDPGSVGALTGTGVGRVCLLIGLALEAVAVLWIRRILRSDA